MLIRVQPKTGGFYTGGGTPSGVSDTSACSLNCAAGLTPQAARCGTPHCGLRYGFREAVCGRVPSIRYQIKNHPQGVALIWYEC